MAEQETVGDVLVEMRLKDHFVYLSHVQIWADRIQAAHTRELAALRANALRYRQLRDEFTWSLASFFDGTKLVVQMPGIVLSVIGPDASDFDAAIDAAIAAREPKT